MHNVSGSGRDLDAEMIPGVIGRLEKTVIDCPDPRALAEFYCQVLGMRINEDIGSWVVIGSGPGLRQLAFQRATDWIRVARA
jgi:catechol 2,3-dioxygenase-like lactoylglutathione lyase family enzyme